MQDAELTGDNGRHADTTVAPPAAALDSPATPPAAPPDSADARPAAVPDSPASRLRRGLAVGAAGLLAAAVALAVIGAIDPASAWQVNLGRQPARAVHAAGVTRPAVTAVPVDPAPAATEATASPSPSPLEVPAVGAGTWTLATGASAVVGAGRLRRYQVVVEDGTGQSAEEFASAVEQTLADPRGWTAGQQWAFQRVSAGSVDFVVRLATPATVDRICRRYGVTTNGELSCRGGRDVVINLRRWLLGVPWYADDLPEYRHMLINHEVGHFLGHNHERCPGPGLLAPVMQTQTIDLTGCQRNGWPYPDGHSYAGGPPAP